jgi:surfactin synthase thioesterase subunit
MAAFSWVKRCGLNPHARVRLFCFPHAGGPASTYYSWSQELPREIEVCPVQLPDRDGDVRRVPYTDLAPLKRKLVQVLLPYLDIPFGFFGHSMGGLIGFELARELRARKMATPICLFVSAHRAPQLPNANAPISHLPDPAFIAELRRLDGTPEAVLDDPELMKRLLPLLRADFAICETYVYLEEKALNFPISAFGGRDDTVVTRDELSAWRSQTQDSFSLRILPGGHFFLFSARTAMLQAVAHDLKQILRLG